MFSSCHAYGCPPSQRHKCTNTGKKAQLSNELSRKATVTQRSRHGAYGRLASDLAPLPGDVREAADQAARQVQRQQRATSEGAAHLAHDSNRGYSNI